MRITAQAKQQTRQRLLRAGDRLFRKRGFAQTTTREIADAAGIANGTLFNYFPTKEALALALFADAIDEARVDFDAAAARRTTLEEDLYALIMTGLRRLEPYRSYVGDVFAVVMSPFARAGACPQADDLRREHLEIVLDLLRAHGAIDANAQAQHDVLVHLYWTVYLGVVAFWTRDESPERSDTLVVLDQSLKLLLGSVHDPMVGKEVSSG